MPKSDLINIYEVYRQAKNGIINEGEVHPDDTVTPNEGPGGVLELQPQKDGTYQHPEPPAKGEDSENSFKWDPMKELAPIAEKIRELLQSSADDESGPEHYQEAAKIVAGSPNDWAPGEYEELVDKLAFVISKFAGVQMNP